MLRSIPAVAHFGENLRFNTTQAEDQPGFPDALLDILEAEQEAGVRLSSTSIPTLFAPSLALTKAAVVYLKNRITKGWSVSDEYSPTNAKPIPEEEKANFRKRLVPVLATSAPPIRAQLIPTLQKILSYDFPSKWPEFLDITQQLLNAGDANSVFAGIQCLLAICRIYRFKATEDRQEFDGIVQVTFPQLLNIGTRLVGETSLEAGEMLRTILKVYKHAIYVSSFLSRLDYFRALTLPLSSSCPPRCGTSKPWLDGARSF